MPPLHLSPPLWLCPVSVCLWLSPRSPTCRGLLHSSPHLSQSLGSWLALRAALPCASQGCRAAASDEGGREGTTCCSATVPWISQPPQSVSKATWGDVVTAVGRRFLVRGGAGMGSGSVEFSVTPQSGPRPQNNYLEAKRERQSPSRPPRWLVLSCSQVAAVSLPCPPGPAIPTPAICPHTPSCLPTFSMHFTNIYLLVLRPFSPNFGWKLSVR